MANGIEELQLSQIERDKLEFIVWQYAPSLPDEARAELVARLKVFIAEVTSRVFIYGTNTGLRNAYQEDQVEPPD